jgi:hypothetical protein
MPKTLPLLLIGLALIASACGSHRNVTVRHGIIEIRRGVPESSLFKGVLAIRRGSRASEVRSAFGTPFTKVSSTFRGKRETCWAYHAHQAGTSLDALDFCMNEAQRVERILIGIHL